MSDQLIVTSVRRKSPSARSFRSIPSTYDPFPSVFDGDVIKGYFSVSQKHLLESQKKGKVLSDEIGVRIILHHLSVLKKHPNLKTTVVCATLSRISNLGLEQEIFWKVTALNYYSKYRWMTLKSGKVVTSINWKSFHN